MSSRNFIEPGQDLTLLADAATNAQIHQAIREAAPETDIGWIVLSETTPDVVTYPEYETFFWIKVSTGEVKYWNGSSWDLISTKITIPDGSITIDKLIATGGTAGQLIRVNVGGSFEFVNAEDIFSDHSIPVDKLEQVDPGDMLLGDDTGNLVATNFEDEFVSLLTFAQVPVAQLYDLSVAGLAGQTLKLLSPGGQFGFDWPDQMLRQNMVATDRILYPSGTENKVLMVNSGRTNVTGVAMPEINSAILSVDAAIGVDGQTIAGGAEARVLLNTTVSDPGSIIEDLDTLTGIFTLGPGSYIVRICVPFYIDTPNVEVFAHLKLYNETTSAVVRHSTCSSQEDESIVHGYLVAYIAPVTETEYSVKFSSKSGSDDVILGIAVDFEELGEVHSQVEIQKIG